MKKQMQKIAKCDCGLANYALAFSFCFPKELQMNIYIAKERTGKTFESDSARLTAMLVNKTLLKRVEHWLQLSEY